MLLYVLTTAFRKGGRMIDNIKGLSTAQCILGITMVLAVTYLLSTGKASIELNNNDNYIKLSNVTDK